MVGLLSMALVAPNALQSLKILKGNRYYKQKKYYYNKYTRNLIKKGLLKEIHKENKSYVVLTEKGSLFLKTQVLATRNETKKNWDGKWRVCIFDVYEKNRKKRDYLRRKIKEFGFTQLQQSVWIYPYDCIDFIKILKDHLNFKKNIRYLLVEKIDNDTHLKKHFNL